MAEKFDIVVVGGGMVGLCLASLVKPHFRIAIIDPQPLLLPENLPAEYDCRVSALSRASESILNHAGAWKNIPLNRITDYDTMNVWEANGSSELNFTAQELAEPNLGHIIENQVIRSALAKDIINHPNVRVYQQTIEDFDRTDNKIKCLLKDNIKLDASLVIGADGALSFVRKHFQFELNESSYQQKALVANIKTERPHEKTAWQRFLTTGPIAHLPMPEEHLCSIVWSAQNELADELLALTPKEQENRIAIALDHRLGRVTLETELRAFPLIARHSEHYLQERIALVGDAAHTIHPLAGQGVNLGFLDAAVLADLLIHLKDAGKDIGVLRNLRPYERTRKGHNHLIQKSMSALNWIYQDTKPALVLARNFGVNLINHTSVVKKQFIRQAMGIHEQGIPFVKFVDHL